MTAKKRKKGIRIVLSVIVAVLLAMVALPFAFKGKIMEIAKQELNKQLNANVDFETLRISLFRNFPNASLSLKNVKIIGLGDFSKDTLLCGKDINLAINLKSLFSDTGYDVKKIEINDIKVFAHVLKDGRANWNITKTDTVQKTKDTAASPSNFKLKLQSLKINRTDIVYIDEQNEMSLHVKNLNHRLSGDFTADSTMLSTQTSIDAFDLWNKKIKYANKIKLNVQADVKADFKAQKYTLANNLMQINAIRFSVNGWVQTIGKAMNMDLALNTQHVDFKSVLSLIPTIYAKSFEKIKTDGKVDLSGFAKGKMEGKTYPAFDIKLNVKEAWFQYPDLPKSVQKINIAGRIFNPGGSLDATVVDLPTFSFSMGDNPFSGNLHLENPISDLAFALKALGKIDLGMIKEVYPLEKGTQLNGLLDINLNASGRMSYVEKKQYENFKFGGAINLKDILLKTNKIKQDVAVNNANLMFNDRYLNLANLSVKIGQNDLTANGKVENYMAYALQQKNLKGDFSLSSNMMNLNDFVSSDKKEGKEEKKDTASTKVIELPKNLDLALMGNFKKLIYSKMNFDNATVNMKLYEGDLKINNMSVDGFGGKMTLTGAYSTSNPAKPAVNFDLNLTEISFPEIFKQVDMLKKFAPIFEQAVGKFNSKLSINTLLQSNMMPVLESVLGSGALNTKSVAIKDVNALTQLASSLKMPEIAGMALKDIALLFDIKDGKINTKPFNIKMGDVQMNLGGSTGIDQTIAYTGKVRLPDKLSLGKFSNVGFKIGGTFTKPKVELDLMNTLQDLVDEKKNEAMQQINDAKDKAINEVKLKREQALKEAQAQADKLLAGAKSAGDRLVEQAQKQGEALVEKASNPITREVAKRGAEQLVKEAQKQADNLYKQAQTEANKLMQQASEKSELK